MKLLDTMVKTETGKPIAKKYFCIKSKVCRVLTVYFLGAMNKEDKKESDYLSLSLSSTLQSTEWSILRFVQLIKKTPTIWPRAAKLSFFRSQFWHFLVLSA